MSKIKDFSLKLCILIVTIYIFLTSKSNWTQAKGVKSTMQYNTDTLSMIQSNCVCVDRTNPPACLLTTLSSTVLCFNVKELMYIMIETHRIIHKGNFICISVTEESFSQYIVHFLT